MAFYDDYYKISNMTPDTGFTVNNTPATGGLGTMAPPIDTMAQPEQVRKSPYDNLNSRMGLGNLNVGQFARLAGMAASAIDPNSPMGRLGAGVANIAGEQQRYNAEFDDREQQRIDNNKKYEAAQRVNRMNHSMTMIANKNIPPAMKGKLWGSFASDWNKDNPDYQLPTEMPMNDQNSEVFKKVTTIMNDKTIDPAMKQQTIAITLAEAGIGSVDKVTETFKPETQKNPQQVIVGDKIKYRNEDGSIVEGLGGPRYKPTSGVDSAKEAKRDAKDAKKEQLKVFDDAIRDYDHNIQFAKGQLQQAKIYDSQNAGATKYQEMVSAINENQKQRDITAARRREYLGEKPSQQSKQAAVKKQVGTKDGKPVYDIGNGNWQVGD